MTDRYAALLVTLNSDIRDDDPFVANLIAAIRMFREVATVTPIVSTIETSDVIVRERSRTETRRQVAALLRDLLDEQR